MLTQTQAALRRFITARLLTERCTLLAPDTAQHASGGAQPTYSPVSTDLPCRVLLAGNRYTGSATINGERATIADTVRLLLPHDAQVSAGMRVQIGASTYAITDIQDDLTSALYVQAFAYRLRG
jgi:hypothetical protein